MNSGIRAITVRSWAKVNLTLDVLGLRPDGYHNLESVVQTISLHDTITVELSGRPSTIRIECDMPGIPTDERNLAYKAAQLFSQARGTDAGIHIAIRKQIPSEAGLGGGSSNAAATHAALRVLLDQPSTAGGLERSRRHLIEKLSQIGSDVPAFLSPGTSIMTGRGDLVAELRDAPDYWLLVLKPLFGVSTAWAYQRLDEVKGGDSREFERASPSMRMIDYICAGDRDLLPKSLSNDLEEPVIERFPEIGRLKAELLDAGARGSLMCGSGSAVFGLFDTEEQSRLAEARFAGRELQTFVTRTLSRQEALEIRVEQ